MTLEDHHGIESGEGAKLSAEISSDNSRDRNEMERCKCSFFAIYSVYHQLSSVLLFTGKGAVSEWLMCRTLVWPCAKGQLS